MYLSQRPTTRNQKHERPNNQVCKSARHLPLEALLWGSSCAKLRGGPSPEHLVQAVREVDGRGALEGGAGRDAVHGPPAARVHDEARHDVLRHGPVDPPNLPHTQPARLRGTFLNAVDALPKMVIGECVENTNLPPIMLNFIREYSHISLGHCSISSYGTPQAVAVLAHLLAPVRLVLVAARDDQDHVRQHRARRARLGARHNNSS